MLYASAGEETSEKISVNVTEWFSSRREEENSSSIRAETEREREKEKEKGGQRRDGRDRRYGIVAALCEKWWMASSVYLRSYRPLSFEPGSISSPKQRSNQSESDSITKTYRRAIGILRVPQLMSDVLAFRPKVTMEPVDRFRSVRGNPVSDRNEIEGLSRPVRNWWNTCSRQCCKQLGVDVVAAFKKFRCSGSCRGLETIGHSYKCNFLTETGSIRNFRIAEKYWILDLQITHAYRLCDFETVQSPCLINLRKCFRKILQQGDCDFDCSTLNQKPLNVPLNDF